MYSTIPSRLKSGNEQGYILLMMMLVITMLAIAATAVAPGIAFQIRRDREEELIHRGVQYSRAIRRYVKKFGRYPTRIEELENTNNMRFLRKRYKDPVTGQDFKPLHLGEVQTAFGGGIAGATPVSALNAVPGVPTLGGAAPGFGTQPRQTQTSSVGAVGATTNTNAGSTNASDQNQNAAGQNPPGDESNAQSDSGAPAQPAPAGGNTTPQTFGGGPIVGVVSTSKKETIRVFNKKNHYDQWQFIYDPNSDRGGLLNTPAQPPLQGVAPQVGQTGQPGQPTGTAPGIQLGTSPQNPTVQPIQPQQPQQQPPPEQ
ncbi:MAG TPA: hypothetical protein VGV15_11180 [Terriglobales bacterium]|nr:hypothetical protein [Terriglobales bacterium]